MLEGNSGTSLAKFKIELGGTTNQPVTFTYQTMDGTATAGEDYVAVPPTTVTFATVSVPP